uniref:Uncharacterized protein n=1 Tax=viral metagenome TaxID=1070528 RepID=A0A6C0EUT4_9ZZZZ
MEEQTITTRVKKYKNKNKILLIIEDDEAHNESNNITDEDVFWEKYNEKNKPTQIDRYNIHNSPESIKKFIRIGGGNRMGTTLEDFARSKFSILEKRSKGKNETGYDHKIHLASRETIYVEQKSSGHWSDDDFKWQHVEIKHKWNILLLCGIGYEEVKFWLMNRNTFVKLIEDKKITNQGNKSNESSEGMWFNYSDVKDSLTRVRNNSEIIQFITNTFT